MKVRGPTDESHKSRLRAEKSGPGGGFLLLRLAVVVTGQVWSTVVHRKQRYVPHRASGDALNAFPVWVTSRVKAACPSLETIHVWVAAAG